MADGTAEPQRGRADEYGAIADGTAAARSVHAGRSRCTCCSPNHRLPILDLSPAGPELVARSVTGTWWSSTARSRIQRLAPTAGCGLVGVPVHGETADVLRAFGVLEQAR